MFMLRAPAYLEIVTSTTVYMAWHTALKLKYVPRRGPHVYLAAVFGGVTVEAFVPAVQINILVGQVELILP